MPELPPDWQSRMVEMIRGATPVDDSWFAGGPVCTPQEQIEIYVRQYRLRLYRSLLDEIPGLAGLLGDSDEGEALLRRYLMAHPSGSWTLNRVADRLADWLAEQPGVPVHHVEMAQLDRAVQQGFEARSGEPLDPARLAQMPALRLQPHVTLLRLTHNVHALRATPRREGVEPPALESGDYPLVVFRRGIKMRHWVMPLGAWSVLREIDRGHTVPEALEAVFAKGVVSADELTTEIGQWFRDYAERDLVELAE